MRFVFAAVWVLCTAAAVLAQTPRGQLVGRVTDPTKAVVAAAAVKATHIETNVASPTTSNSEGNFEFRNLLPGTYRLETVAAGFKRYVREPIEVRVGDVLSADVTLEVGDATESVTVTAETPLLEAATGSLGAVVDNRRIQDLPTAGNSVVFLMQSSPGVISTVTPTHPWGPNVFSTPNGMSVGGAQFRKSEFAIDGNPIMGRDSFTFNPPPEMIQEIRVESSSYDASIGRFTGAYVNMVTRSGTNQIHGALVHQVMSRGLMARDFFTNRVINNPATGPVTQAKIDTAWPPQRVARPRGGARVAPQGL